MAKGTACSSNLADIAVRATTKTRLPSTHPGLDSTHSGIKIKMAPNYPSSKLYNAHIWKAVSGFLGP